MDDGKKTAGASATPEQPSPGIDTVQEAARKKARRRRIWLLSSIAVIFVVGFGVSAWIIPSLRERIPILDHLLPAPPPQAGRIGTLESEVGSLKQSVASLTAREDAQAFDTAALRRQNEGLSIQIADLEGRLNQLTGGTVGTAGGHPIPGGGSGSRVDMLTNRIAQLEAAFIPLSHHAQSEAEAAKDRAAMHNRAAELEKEITTFNDRLAALEAFAATDRQGSILGLTLVQLRTTIDSGQPFETALGLLLDLVPDQSLKKDSPIRDNIKTLQSYAPEGVATTDQLTQRFDRMSVAVLRAAAIPEDASWLGRAWGRIKGLVVIRKRGEVPGNTASAILARAEVRLGEDDLDGALTELDALKGSAAEAAKPWRDSAEARQNVDAAIEQLSSQMEEEASRPAPTAPKPAASTKPLNKGVR
jgi:hypothetical protein